VLLEPAKEVGGDLVDHFAIADGTVVLALGDVSDKGAGAALMMARTHALLRGLAARPDAAALFGEPARAVELVNAALAEGNASCSFVTFFLATLDVASGRLAYVRAGHVPPYHRNGSGAVRRLEALGGPPLGLDETCKYRSGEAVLAPGDHLLMITDGLTEAHDLQDALYGDARVAQFMAAVAPDDPDALARLAGEVRAFAAGRPAFDDMAALLLAYGVP